MEYRKFKLVNGVNEEYELTNPKFKVFGNNPQGLGYTKTLSVLRLGDENLSYYSLVNLDDINLELLFYDDKLADKYTKYQQFINFLSFKPLYLLYQRPNSFTWYRKRVESLSLGKTEVNHNDSMLHCPFVMQSMSFWEDNEKKIIEAQKGELEGGKVYPIEYVFNYGQSNISNMNMVSVGLLDAPLEITIDGAVTNPSYVLYDSNNDIYGRTRFVGSFDQVYVNSKESEEEIKLIRGGLLLDNPLGYQDLTVGSANEIYVTFLKLKTGSSKISFFLDVEFTGKVRIEWRNRYVSV